MKYLLIDVKQPRKYGEYLILAVSEWNDTSTRVVLFQSAGIIIKNPTQRVGQVQSGSHHHFIEN